MTASKTASLSEFVLHRHQSVHRKHSALPRADHCGEKTDGKHDGVSRIEG
jgi:hypothetical protein